MILLSLRSKPAQMMGGRAVAMRQAILTTLLYDMTKR